jgi:hypothetical protein
MKKFNPVDFNRERWGDKTNTKNHPPQCTEHKYCHVSYEWREEGKEHGNIITFVGGAEGDAGLKLPEPA